MPDITVQIGASNASLQTVLADTMKRLKGLSGGIQSALAPLAAIAGPALALAGLGAGFAGVALAIKGTIEKGRELQEVMLRTGQSAGSILKLQGAFRAAKLDVEGIGPAINKLQKALSGVNEDGDDTTNVFSKLGLNARALSKLDSATQFAQIGAALQKIQDPAERANRVMQIFGKSGGEFLQLFNDSGAMSGLTSGLSSSQALMARNVNLYARINALWDQFIAKAKSGFGLFAGLTAGLAPILDELLEKLPKIDLSGLGKQIGNVIAILGQAFMDGRIGELLGLSLKVGAVQGVNYLYAGLRGVLAAGGTGFADMAAIAVRALNVLNTENFWAGMAHSLTAVAMRFSAKALEANAYLQAGFDLLFDRIAGGFKNLLPVLLDLDTKTWSVWFNLQKFALSFLMSTLGKIVSDFAAGFSAALHGNSAEAAKAVKNLLVGALDPLGIGDKISQYISTQVSGKKDEKPKSYDDYLQPRLAESRGRSDELNRSADSEASKGGFDVSSLVSMSSQIPGLLSNMQSAFAEGQAGAGSPLKADNAEEALDHLLSKLSSELNRVADNFNLKKQPGAADATAANPNAANANASDAAKKNDDGKQNGDEEAHQKTVDDDQKALDKAKKDRDEQGSVKRPVSSLSQIGGGGYGNRGSLSAVMNQSLREQQRLNQLVAALSAKLEQDKKKGPLTHLTSGASGGGASVA